MLCECLKGVTANRVYALRQGKMMMVAVVPQRQADRQTLNGCILPERKSKAVKLLLGFLPRHRRRPGSCETPLWRWKSLGPGTYPVSNAISIAYARTCDVFFMQATPPCGIEDLRCNLPSHPSQCKPPMFHCPGFFLYTLRTYVLPPRMSSKIADVADLSTVSFFVGKLLPRVVGDE